MEQNKMTMMEHQEEQDGNEPEEQKNDQQRSRSSNMLKWLINIGVIHLFQPSINARILICCSPLPKHKATTEKARYARVSSRFTDFINKGMGTVREEISRWFCLESFVVG